MRPQASTSEPLRSISISTVREGQRGSRDERIAVEEPLEIRLARAGEAGPGQAVSITMRTPGEDVALALGFLHGEGLIRSRADIVAARACGDSGNVVRVEVKPGIAIDAKHLARNFYTTSSCGVCGKASLDAVRASIPAEPIASTLRVGAAQLESLAATALAAQRGFRESGGLHAASLFDAQGRLLAAHEDVGRHNALDKLIGTRLLADALPLSEGLLLLSGRAGFELVQKAAVARVPVIAAIGAPSSLAIELAEQQGIMLIGFLRGTSFNVYAHAERLQ